MTNPIDEYDLKRVSEKFFLQKVIIQKIKVFNMF